MCSKLALPRKELYWCFVTNCNQSLTVKMSFCILPSRFRPFQQCDPEFLCCRYVPVQQNVKGKRLERPLGFQEFEAPVISRESAQEGSKVYAPATFTQQEICLVLVSVRG